jgi:hypothetical protein
MDEILKLRERVRDFIYDCTKDEFGSGWTLSAHQTDDVIEMIAKALRTQAQSGIDND